MFARISGSLAGELVVDTQVGSENYPANVWIWNEQTIQAQRRRFKCAPFQSIHANDSTDVNSSNPGHRTALVCRAARRCKQAHAQHRQSYKHSAPSRAHVYSSFSASHASTHASSSNSKGSWQTAAQQQKQQAVIDPEQLTACIKAATCYHQLEALCNTFLHNASFSCQHAALVISQLHKVHSRAQDGQLLLVELLAAKLTSCSCCSSACKQGLQPGEVAAVFWGFARAGYQPDAGLLQQLLQQFWAGYDQQQQQQALGSWQQQTSAAAEALATLVAGLAGLGFRDSSTWDRLRTNIQQQMPSLSSACLQQVVWGLATAQQSDVSLTAAVAAEVGSRLAEFSAEELVQVVWCLHVLGCQDLGLFEQASQQMAVRVGAHAAVVGGSATSTASKREPAQQTPRQQQQQSGNVQQHLSKQFLQQQSTQQRQQQGRQIQNSSNVVAALCSAAASQAYSVLEKYDPLMSTLLLYKKLQPAHGL